MNIILIDLFSGVGGFTLGLKQAGFNITHHYFSEIDKKAVSVYRYHFPKSEYVGSVTDFSAKGIREKHPDAIIIVTWGFPCQDLSIAGKRKGLEGERSGLYYDAVRILHEAQADLSIFENVYGLISSNEGNDLHEVITHLYKNGFITDFDEMNTSWIIPQNRRRIYGVSYNIKSLLKWVISETGGQKQKLPTYMNILEGYLQNKFVNTLTDHQKQLSIRETNLVLEQSLKGICEKLSGLNLKYRYLKIIKNLPSQSLPYLYQDIQKLLLEQQELNGNSSQLKSRKKSIVRDIELVDTDGIKGEKDQYLLLNIERLLKSLSEESLKKVSKSIILILTKSTIESKTYSYVEMQEYIELFIIHLSLLFPNCYKWAFCTLTNQKVFTKYARNRKTEKGINEARGDFSLFQFSTSSEVTNTCSFGCVGEECCRQILPIRYSDLTDLQEEARRDLRERIQARENGVPRQCEQTSKDCNCNECESKHALCGCVNDKGIIREVKTSTAIDSNYFKGLDNHAQRTHVQSLNGSEINPTIRNGGRGSTTEKHNWDLVKVGTYRTHKDGEGFREMNNGECPTIPARAREDGSGQPVIEYKRTPLSCNTGGVEEINKESTRIRRLTEVETERLQGFPDYWTLYGIDEKGEIIEISSTQRYKQMGNAVSVPIVKAVGLQIKKDLCQSK